jgi:hypothetical protein
MPAPVRPGRSGGLTIEDEKRFFSQHLRAMVGTIRTLATSVTIDA